jgi:hypothetical protein
VVGENQVKLCVPADDLAKFYEALANESSPPAIQEHMGKSTAYSIDLKVCNLPGDSVETMLEGDASKTPAQPGLLRFAQYAAANVAEVYGAAQPFLVYAAKYMDDRTTLPTVIMRVHFPGVLVNKDRHAMLTKKIKESVEYRTLSKQELVTQVVELGEFLHRCCHDQNSWPTALREQLEQEKRGIFRIVFADYLSSRGAPTFDNSVMKPYAIFNSPDERMGGGKLDGIQDEEQTITHLKMATKRPLDCDDTKGEHLSNDNNERIADDEYVTKWVKEPTVKKTDTRTGYGGSVDTEPGAKPRARNSAPDKRSNLNVDEFLKTWDQVSGRFDVEKEETSEGITKFCMTNMNGKATVTLNKKEKSATLSNQDYPPNAYLGVQSAFEAAVTAGQVKK